MEHDHAVARRGTIKKGHTIDITTVGLDLAKNVFQVHAVNAVGEVILRHPLRRAQVLAFLKSCRPAWLAWRRAGARTIGRSRSATMGHTVRLMPAVYMKAYVKRNKTDTADAEAICEAVTRPTMRFVAATGVGSSHRIESPRLANEERIQSIDALRGHMAELGL